MRGQIAIASAVAVLAAASKRADDDKAWVDKKTLTHISGLVIKKTRTHPVSAAMLATRQGQTRPIMVGVNTIAAGTEETYS